MSIGCTLLCRSCHQQCARYVRTVSNWISAGDLLPFTHEGTTTVHGRWVSYSPMYVNLSNVLLLNTNRLVLYIFGHIGKIARYLRHEASASARIELPCCCVLAFIWEADTCISLAPWNDRQGSDCTTTPMNSRGAHARGLHRAAVGVRAAAGYGIRKCSGVSCISIVFVFRGLDIIFPARG